MSQKWSHLRLAKNDELRKMEAKNPEKLASVALKRCELSLVLIEQQTREAHEEADASSLWVNQINTTVGAFGQSQRAVSESSKSELPAETQLLFVTKTNPNSTPPQKKSTLFPLLLCECFAHTIKFAFQFWIFLPIAYWESNPERHRIFL